MTTIKNIDNLKNLSPKSLRYIKSILTAEQLDDILEIETGCRFGYSSDECNHPDCKNYKNNIRLNEYVEDNNGDRGFVVSDTEFGKNFVAVRYDNEKLRSELGYLGGVVVSKSSLTIVTTDKI